MQLGIATTDTYHAAVNCLKELRVLSYFTLYA